ncbi:MAG: acetyl-CoA carboxylase biotin carboxyl carrier protein subunit [Firmicutes bacterium]|nr:acetyl-CoA carboxylase biotin carboxyl carrier protein subunit [Bacillota bacterium]
MYEVEVEEIGGAPAGPQPAPVVRATSPTPPAPPAVPAPAPKAAPAPVAPSGNGSGVAAPMPGTITDVRVKVGDRVEPRTVVMMLEAMKMENEIFAGRAGVVSQIAVDKGASVNTGDLLVSVDPA